MAATAKAGCLIVLDSHGTVRETISGHGINGPWDMAALGKRPDADLFVTNVLNGTVAANGAVVHRGTVLRLLVRAYWNSPPKLLAVTKIGSGFSEQTNASAFIIGPTGVGLTATARSTWLTPGRTGSPRIPYAATRMSSAGTGFVLTSGGQAQRTAGPGHRAERRRAHRQRRRRPDRRDDDRAATQVAHRFLDRSGSPPGSGALFGLAVAPQDGGVYYVDDATNILRLLH